MCEDVLPFSRLQPDVHEITLHEIVAQTFLKRRNMSSGHIFLFVELRYTWENFKVRLNFNLNQNDARSNTPYTTRQLHLGLHSSYTLGSAVAVALIKDS